MHPMAQRLTHAGGRAVSPATYRELARFRYELRRFLRFSEKAARSAGVTPQQHQLLLGIAGFTGRGWANVSELAEFMQLRHNAVVGLITRAARARLVRKALDPDDRRVVRVELSPRGAMILNELTQLHQARLNGTGMGRQGEPVFVIKGQ